MRRWMLAGSIGVGALAIALALVLVLANQDDGESASSTTSTTVLDEAEPVTGGILRVGLERLDTLDPAEADQGIQAEAMVADLIFDGLTELGVDGEIRPAVAESWEHEELKLWRFRLGARTFHDGQPITADDVVFTLQRLAARGPSSGASVQLELVDGYRAFAVDGVAETLAGLTAPDERTVEIRLVEPLATFPDVLAAPAFGIVPRAAAAGPTEPPFGDEPIGSGPFSFANREGDLVVLQRAEGRTTYVDAIHLQQFDTAAEAYDGVVAGDVDVARVPGDRVADAEQRFPDAVRAPYVAELYYGFNLSSPVLGDVRLREAIVAAIDREALVADVYQGTAVVLDGLVPSGVAGHQGSPCAKCAHDPERARALLADLYPDSEPPEIFIDYDEGPPQDLVAAKIHEALRAVGIPAAMRPHRFDADAADSYQAFLASDRQQVFRLGWIGAAANADAYLAPLFRTDAPDNITGFSNPDVDLLLAEARATADGGQRLAKYQDAERRILDQMAVLPLAQFRTWLVTGPAVRDLDLTVLGTLDSASVWLVPSPQA